MLTSHYMDEVERLADRVLVIAHGRGVAAGTPTALRAGRRRSTTIAFRLPHDLALPSDLADLAKSGGDGAVELHTGEPTRVLHRLTDWAPAEGVDLPGLTVLEPSLEDVYLELTGEREAVLDAS